VTYRLVLLRHAKTEAEGPTDAARQLAPKGRKQAENLSKSFAGAGVKPELALVSSALRAQQTWALAAAGKPKIKCNAQILDALYGASVADILGVLRVVSPALQTVVIVGHEPTMAACAAYLADKTSDESALAQVKVGVPTATWSLLQSDYPWIEWGAKSARLVTVRRPKD
jgi:phosphohistidine phosphatase